MRLHRLVLSNSETLFQFDLCIRAKFHMAPATGRDAFWSRLCNLFVSKNRSQKNGYSSIHQTCRNISSATEIKPLNLSQNHDCRAINDGSAVVMMINNKRPVIPHSDVPNLCTVQKLAYAASQCHKAHVNKPDNGCCAWLCLF